MSSKKLILVCFAGLILNLVGYALANILHLPFYLDTSGTMYIAALGGYVPGIAVGFLTKLILALFEPSEMYHCSVMILIAIFAAFFARKGYFGSIKRTLLLIIPLAFLAGTYDLIIDKFLSASSGSDTARIFAWSFTENLLREILDKGIMILLAFTLLKSTPLHLKKDFIRWGQMQAPLTEEMRQNIKAEDYLSSSLRNKLLMIVMLGALFVSMSIATISYLLFKSSAVQDRINTAEGIAAVVMNDIDPARIDDYLEQGYAAEGYAYKKNWLNAIRNSTRSIDHIFVGKIKEDGYHIIFDLNANNYGGKEPGEVVPFGNEVLAPYKDDLIAGKPIPPVISNAEFGYLLTLCKPFYDANGKCVYYVGVNYSMNTLAEYTRDFIIKLLALFVGCFIFIFVISFVFVENHIILPINTMAYCARNFSYDNKEERTKNLERIKSLKIKTGDEIENLYTALIQSSENISKYLENLQLAKIQVENMKVKVYAMDELANTDSLTGIRNKTAYATMIAKLDQHIEDGDAEFCIVMVDVNFLKKVNDNYGHERGNEYLINACRLVCSVFGTEHVYRIGGDEFVVIVTGDKVSLCKYFVKQFQMEMSRKNTNTLLEPWEKISAAVGVAFYQKGVDKNADEVFKRADALMYENKLAMKAQRTD